VLAPKPTDALHRLSIRPRIESIFWTPKTVSGI
jgi:hypothetical protein